MRHPGELGSHRCRQQESCLWNGPAKNCEWLAGANIKVSRRRVHAIMRAHGLVLVRDSEPGEPSGGHVTVPEPNRRLATDLTTVWTRRAGVVALVPTIDCGDPTAVLEVTKDQYGAAILASPVETKFVAAFGRAPEHDEVSPEGTKSEESRATLVPVLQEIGVRAGSSTFANERMLVGASSWRMGRYRGCPLSRVAGHQVAADTTLAIRGVS